MSHNIYPEFSDINEYNEVEYQQPSTESNPCDAIFEMFPNIDKELIIDLMGEMSIEDVIDLLIQLDTDCEKEHKKSINHNNSQTSLSTVACEKVERNDESLLSTLKRRLSNARVKDKDLGEYVELSQMDKDKY